METKMLKCTLESIIHGTWKEYEYYSVHLVITKQNDGRNSTNGRHLNVFYLQKKQHMYLPIFHFFWAAVSGLEPQLHIEFSIANKIKFTENSVVKSPVL